MEQMKYMSMMHANANLFNAPMPSGGQNYFNPLPASDMGSSPIINY